MTTMENYTRASSHKIQPQHGHQSFPMKKMDKPCRLDPIVVDGADGADVADELMGPWGQ